VNNRIMIVDAHNQFLRSYIVNPSLSRDGHPIGGSKGFLGTLNTLTRTISPDMIIVVWDGEGGSQKRRSQNKNYKEGRKPVRLNRNFRHLTEEQEVENRAWQQVRSIEYLNQTPIIQFMEPLVEADDVISHIVQSPKFDKWQKVIISSDKDFIQLLDEKTILYRPTQDQVLNKNKILEEYGIHPTNFALARAMAGDVSDNLKGIRGVGLPTVAKRFPFFAEEETCFIDDVVDYCNNQETNVKVYDRVLEGIKMVKSNYKIMQLYSPTISIQGRTRINEVLEAHVPEFNKTGLRKLMHQDGIGEVSLNSLFESFNRMISDF
jgi:DNA polymerase I